MKNFEIQLSKNIARTKRKNTHKKRFLNLFTQKPKSKPKHGIDENTFYREKEKIFELILKHFVETPFDMNVSESK